MVHSETMIELKSICFPVQSKKNEKKTGKPRFLRNDFRKMVKIYGSDKMISQRKERE